MGKSPIERKMGPAPLYDQNGELMLVNWITCMAVKGFSVWIPDLVQSVEHIMKDLNMKNNFTDGKLGQKWLELFFKRHRECAKRTVEKLTKERENVT